MLSSSVARGRAAGPDGSDRNPLLLAPQRFATDA
jgi:hypothetical protein